MSKARNLSDLLADGVIGSSEIADGAITEAKIGSGAITANKLQTGAAVPTQSGQSGKYLTTDGTTTVWATITDPTPEAVSSQDNTATDYFDLPSGTTAQRPTNPSGGELRYNASLGRAEIYDVSGWNMISTPPTVSTISPTSFNGASGTSFAVTGTKFLSGAVVKFIDSSDNEYSMTTTVVSETELSVTTNRDFTVAEEPLSVKVVNPDGLISNVLANEIDCGGVPTWNTASGQLLQVVQGNAINTSTTATDPDGQAVTYALTSGTLPNSTLNQSTGAITGTAPSVTGDTTYPFNITASDPVGNSVPRSFSILVKQFNDPVLIYNYNQDTGHPADSFSGWGWWHQAASSNGTAFQTNDYIQAECNGLGSTYAGITTALYTAAPLTIPSDHNRLEFYYYLLTKDSNGNDGGGDMYMGLSTNPTAQSYGGSYTHIYDAGNNQIGNIDGAFFTTTVDISSAAGSTSHHAMMTGSGGQNANIDWRLYRVRTYRA